MHPRISLAAVSHARAAMPRIADNARNAEYLGDAIAELAARQHAATYDLLVLLRQFDEACGWNTGFRSCAHWLHWRTGIGLGAAREKVRVARALAVLPHVSAAMQCGEVSYGKVRAVTRVATPENEAHDATGSHAATDVRSSTEDVSAETRPVIARQTSFDEASWLSARRTPMPCAVEQSSRRNTVEEGVDAADASEDVYATVAGASSSALDNRPRITDVAVPAVVERPSGHAVLAVADSAAYVSAETYERRPCPGRRDGPDNETRIRSAPQRRVSPRRACRLARTPPHPCGTDIRSTWAGRSTCCADIPCSSRHRPRFRRRRSVQNRIDCSQRPWRRLGRRVRCDARRSPSPSRCRLSSDASCAITRKISPGVPSSKRPTVTHAVHSVAAERTTVAAGDARRRSPGSCPRTNGPNESCGHLSPCVARAARQRGSIAEPPRAVRHRTDRESLPPRNATEASRF